MWQFSEKDSLACLVFGQEQSNNNNAKNKLSLVLVWSRSGPLINKLDTAWDCYAMIAETSEHAFLCNKTGH